MNKIIIAAATFAAFAVVEAADFQIGVYCLKENARTEQRIKDIRDCHVDFVYGIECTDRKTLDLFAKYGLKARRDVDVHRHAAFLSRHGRGVRENDLPDGRSFFGIFGSPAVTAARIYGILTANLPKRRGIDDA